MKIKTVLLLLLIMIPVALFAQKGEVVSYIPENCEGYIDINGETNLADFHLSQVLDHQLYLSVEDTHWARSSDSSSTTEIHIPVKQFNTGNPFLYHDFLDLMKAQEHPEIIIKIPNNQLENVFYGYQTIDPRISITLAGISHQYKVECTVNSCSSNGIFLRGEQKIRLTDFNIDPPVKSMGLIRVKNEVIINFGFNLALMNETSFLSK
ncbi:MAG TPA: YceI family protein [Bacteroidales bacterium]|nr:YceI family protein [Bacteroidales bacterium]